MTLVYVSGPADLPVSIQEVKRHTRISEDADDLLVENYIRSALQEIELKSGTVYMPQTWQWIASAFPSEDICLGIGPVTAVESIVYVDADGADQTLDAAEYTVDTVSRVGCISRVGSAWPTTGTSPTAVTVEFTAGRGIVPPSVANAVMSMVARTYDDRAGEHETFGPAAQSMISPHRRIVF